MLTTSPRITYVLAIGILAAALTVPVASADPACDGPYCCDRDPIRIIEGYVNRGVAIVLDAISRTNAFLGKTKCTAYEVAVLCSREEWPPTVSPYRTNPTGQHGHYSPCYEFYAPGFEHLGGCPAAHALRHAFTPSYHDHRCIPLHLVYAPL